MAIRNDLERTSLMLEGIQTMGQGKQPPGAFHTALQKEAEREKEMEQY